MPDNGEVVGDEFETELVLSLGFLWTKDESDHSPGVYDGEVVFLGAGAVFCRLSGETLISVFAPEAF